MEPESGLVDLRSSLLRNLRRDLGPEDGDEAFDRHILLAVRIHRAASLDRAKADGEAWRQYFIKYFPAGHNSHADAQYLWREWRTRLLKHESPRGITHGQPHAHWLRLPEGGICIDLESMWDDFEHSVEAFVRALKADEPQRAAAMQRWRDRAWTIRELPLHPSENLFPGPTLYPGSFGASGTTAATAMSGTPNRSTRPT